MVNSFSILAWDFKVLSRAWWHSSREGIDWEGKYVRGFHCWREMFLFCYLCFEEHRLVSFSSSWQITPVTDLLTVWESFSLSGYGLGKCQVHLHLLRQPASPSTHSFTQHKFTESLLYFRRPAWRTVMWDLSRLAWRWEIGWYETMSPRKLSMRWFLKDEWD